MAFRDEMMVRAGPAGALMLLCDFAGAPNGAELHCEIAEMAPTPDETRASFKAAEAEIETLRRARTRAATLAAVKATKARSATRVPAKATCVTTTSKREKRHGTSTDYQD